MDPQRWGQICAAFDRLADASPAARPALLDALGAGDPDLRREVEAMLDASGEAGAFLEAPLAVAGSGDGSASAITAPPPAAPPLARPDRLGPYELGAFLGAGGMGQVYRARDTRLDREVAIKVLPQATADDPTALARFHREAKAVAALSHPNIVA
ncbi:MAG TPA: protein kinase, partial [Thermoanaerobaculia bacterium]|nr:protein kinase [Thermoanaerobaculia bacterium]